MATVNKDFKIKSGLIVEGTTATVNGYDILTKKPADQTYIIGLIGGAATSEATPDTVVLRDENADFAAGTITADLIGDVTGQVSDISNHSTSGLSEGSNLYFTNQRALDATSAAYDAAGSATTAQSNAEDYADTVSGQAYTDAVAAASSDATTKANDAEANANDYTDGEITTALTTAQGYATTAQDNAEGYADGLISTEVTNRNSAISTAKGEAIFDAGTYTDSAISTEVTNRDSAISTAITNLNLAGTYDALGSADQALADANTYTNGEIAALVDSAPELLDTLNELAAAIADNPNYATDAANAVAGRVAKSGDTMTGDLVLPGAPTLDLHASTKKYVDDQAYLADMSARGYADGVAGDAYDNALADANSYTDGEITTALSTAQGYASTAYTDAVAAASSDATTKANDAEDAANGYTDSAIVTEVSNRNSAISDAISTEVSNRNGAISDAISTEVSDRNSAITSAVNALTTSDIEEGSNQYFTDARAKTSAADLLTGATLTNITITGSGSGLTITAENGVADSNTDQLAEGEDHLYFTNQRVIDAVDNAVINPQAVVIDTFRKEEASYTSVASASTAVCHSASTVYGSMKYLVRVTASVSGTVHSHVSEVLATVDNTNGVAVVEYGTIYTSLNPLATMTVEYNASTEAYDLKVTTANNSSEVMVAATLLVAND